MAQFFHERGFNVSFEHDECSELNSFPIIPINNLQMMMSRPREFNEKNRRKQFDINWTNVYNLCVCDSVKTC